MKEPEDEALHVRVMNGTSGFKRMRKGGTSIVLVGVSLVNNFMKNERLRMQ